MAKPRFYRRRASDGAQEVIARGYEAGLTIVPDGAQPASAEVVLTAMMGSSKRTVQREADYLVSLLNAAWDHFYKG